MSDEQQAQQAQAADHRQSRQHPAQPAAGAAGASGATGASGAAGGKSVDEIVDAWFQECIVRTPIAKNTDTYNAAHKAADELKRRLRLRLAAG
jgi:hypothetical protein